MNAWTVAKMAEMEALKATIEGMKAENEYRQQQGLSNAYGDTEFQQIAEMLMQIHDDIIAGT